MDIELFGLSLKERKNTKAFEIILWCFPLRPIVVTLFIYLFMFDVMFLDTRLSLNSSGKIKKAQEGGGGGGGFFGLTHLY